MTDPKDSVGDGDEDVTAGAGEPVGDVPASDAPNLTAMFSSLVRDAPISRVSPLTVLAEVHAAQRRRRSFRARLGGGIAAAAVVVGGFVLLAPSFGASTSNDSSAEDAAAGGTSAAATGLRGPDATSAAALPEAGAATSAAASPAGSADAASASDNAATSAAGSAASSAASSAAAGSAASSAAAGSSAAATSSGAGVGAQPPGAGTAGAPSGGGTHGGSQPDAITTSAEGGSSAAASTSVPGSVTGAALRPLADPEIKAAVAALPSGSVIAVAGATLPSVHDERAGAVLRMASGGTLTIVLTSGGASDLANSAPLAASRTQDGLTVVVAADATAAAHLTQVQLDAVAGAVLGAMK